MEEHKLSIQTDFPGGSVDVIEIDQEKREIVIQPARDPRHGWEAWWYFSAIGVRSGETITVKLTGGTLATGRSWAWMPQAVYSLDNENWQHTDKGLEMVYEGVPYLVYRQIVDAKQAWFAYAIPYLPKHARSLISMLTDKIPESVPFVLCHTRHERAVPAIRINTVAPKGHQKHVVWLQARCHAFESGGSWALHGLAVWLASDDPAALSLREQADITIVPIMDVDGVVDGRGGKHQKPRDHGRDWDENPHWFSVRESILRIREAVSKGHFDLFVDFHGPGRSAPFFFVPSICKLPELQKRNLLAFLDAIPAKPWTDEARKQYSCSNFYYVEDGESAMTCGMNWVRSSTTPYVVAVVPEAAMRTPLSTIDGYREQGTTLGKGIERYLSRHVRA